MTRLVHPGAEHLGAYCEALRRGWSADTTRGDAVAQAELAQIAADPQTFLAWMDDPRAEGPPVTLPDGSSRPRIPGLRRWLWTDDGFAGLINLRWMPDNAPLPPQVLGHIGYAVVPWQRRRGHATAALAQMLQLARARGMARVELTTDLDNIASQRVIAANGGQFVETFDAGPAYGHQIGLRYAIQLAAPA